jgi:hypothetical protein
MSSMQTIPRTPFEHPSMDFEALRAEGIRLLERMAGHAWTDFNEHDPGITLLEQICYAITELGYRASHSMPDLLAESGDPYRSLYTPRAILPTEPVTVLDLRKLVLDVEGVRDAWIDAIDTKSPALVYHEGKKELYLQEKGATPAGDRYVAPVTLAGLFRVLIAPSDVEDVDVGTMRRNVHRSLHAHRPLCTDFTEVKVLEPEKIQVNARIEIAAGSDPQSLLVTLYEKLTSHIAPSFRFRTLGEMIAAGKSIDEIFSGPRLARGFLDAEEIERRGKRTELHTSDVLRELMDVPGVRVVHDLTLQSNASATGQPERWTLALRPDQTPQLDLDLSAITLVLDGVALMVDVASAIARYKSNKKSAARARPPTDAELDRIPPPGRDRRTSRYTSIMHELPACYGVGAIGLSEAAPLERRAQQKQLRAYLLFFDQLLCNTFAQLGHVPALLSFEGEGTRTYASQLVDDETLGLGALRKRPKDEHERWLRDRADDPSPARSPSERAHRFLDHLLARFAETPSGYAPLVSGNELVEEARARDKRAFLRAYPRISGARGTASDISLPSGEENRAGLAERISRQLGLSSAENERFLLIEHILLRPIEEDLNQLEKNAIRITPILAASPLRDPYSLQLSFIFPDWPGRFSKAEFRDLVVQTVKAETPAHLVPYVRWLAKDPFDVAAAAYSEWLSSHQNYWLEKLGV